MLELRNIRISFEDAVIEDGSLTLPSGKITALTGPSGSGKTTLLYCVGLISSLRDYEYLLNGRKIDLSSEKEKGKLRKKKIGYVFQENNLNQNQSVLENVRLSASLAGADTDEEHVKSLLSRVGLEGRETDYPKTLSGGEQQRVAIACALAKEPEIVIADEPTSSLDAENTEQVLKLLEEIAAEGKTVVIATHSPQVVERCDLVYEIKDKKPVLVKGEAEENESREKESLFKKLKGVFYWRYAIKQKRGQTLKRITIAISALAIAFTALSTGYIKDFGEQQRAYFKTVSNRELTVAKRFNPNYQSTRIFDYYTPSLSENQIHDIQTLEHVERVEPVVYFQSFADLSLEGIKVFYDREILPGSLNSNIRYCNRAGKAGEQAFCPYNVTDTLTGEELYDPGEGTIKSSYFVASYLAYESMDLKCEAIDLTVAPNTGIYVPAQIIGDMGLSKDDLNDLEFTIDVAVPQKRMIEEIQMEQSDGKQFPLDNAMDWCVQTQITLPVRGILADDVSATVLGAGIYAPSEIMMTYVEENRIDEIPTIYFEKDPGAKDSIKDTYDWRPWAYYLLVDDVSDIDAIKEAVAKIDPNLDVIHEYQDYSAVMEAVDNTQKVVLYISIAILSVVLLLSAIVYVSVIDRRKYEFAFLRANGLTKRELRKLVLCDTALQAVITFLVALVFAYVAHLLLTTSVGGFVFDGMTILWLAVISVISVILPSIIALVLTNKYEPDAIMRN